MEELPTYTGPGYCVKCKCKRQMTAAAVSKSPNGVYVAKGECPESGTRMSALLGRKWPKP